MSFWSNLLQKGTNFVKQTPTPYSYVKKIPRAREVIQGTANFAKQTGLGVMEAGQNISNANTRLSQNRAYNVINPASLITRYTPKIQQNNRLKTESLLNRNQPKSFVEKAGRFTGQNLPYMAIPSTALPRAIKMASPVVKVLGAGLFRGAEGAAQNAVYKYGKGESAKQIAKGVPTDIALGAAINTAFSPKQVLNAIKFKGVVSKMDAPIPKSYSQLQEGAGNLYKPNVREETVPIQQFEQELTGSKTSVNRMNEEGFVTRKYDKETGKLLTWSTNNPIFAKRMQEGNIQFGMSTRNVKPSESPLSNEAKPATVFKVKNKYGTGHAEYATADEAQLANIKLGDYGGGGRVVEVPAKIKKGVPTINGQPLSTTPKTTETDVLDNMKQQFSDTYDELARKFNIPIDANKKKLFISQNTIGTITTPKGGFNNVEAELVDRFMQVNRLDDNALSQATARTKVTTPITPTTPTEGLSGVKPNSLRIQTKPTRQVPSLVKSPESKMPVAKVQEVTNRVGEDVSFDNIISKSDTNVKDKVNIIDMFRTPDRVLNKIGLGEEAKVLRTQYDKYLKELPQEIDKIGEWAKQTTPQENNNIFKFLDGQSVTLNPKETKIASEVQTYLKDWADKLGLPKDRRITNYITHIFDKDLIQKEFPEELAKIIDEKVAGSVYDPFVLERLGKKGYIEDTWRALDAYAKRATRKYNIDTALEPIKAKAEKLELSQFKYVKNYIDRINMRPTELDNMVDNFIKSTPIGYKLGQRPTTALTRNARQMVYRGTLGLNVGSTLKNLSQGANTYARLGERYTVKGYLDLFKNYRSTELKDIGVLKDDLLQDRSIGVYKGFLSKLDKGLFYLFETAEKINRGAAYYGAKAKALNEGKTLQEAVEFGKKTVRDTQFTFGSIDTPPILQSDAAKTLLQFQSFNIKQGEFLGEMISKKDLAGLARWIGASLAFVYGVGSAIGMKPKDIIPTIRVGGSPIFGALKETYNAITNAPDEFGNKPENNKERFQPMLKSLVPFVPGGVQGKKTIEGLMANKKGYVETAKGLVRNPITPTTSNKVRGALFGQNNLPESQQYFDSKQNPLGKEQSNIYKKVSDKADYYKSVLDERAKNKEIEKLKGGNGGTTSDGTIIKKIGKEWKEFDTPEEAQKAITKDAFDKSGKKSDLINGTYYYRDKNGDPKDMPEDDFNMKLSTAKLEQAYDSKNYKAYITLAEEKLKLIEAQYENADPLTQIELKNDYNDLLAKVNKYKSYGGFKKPKTNAKKKASITALKGFKVPNLKAPAIKGVPTIRVKATRIKASDLTKV